MRQYGKDIFDVHRAFGRSYRHTGNSGNYTVKRNGTVIELYHYNTLTAIYDAQSPAALLYLNITTRSDSDAVNTLMHVLNIQVYNGEYSEDGWHVTLRRDGSYFAIKNT